MFLPTASFLFFSAALHRPPPRRLHIYYIVSMCAYLCKIAPSPSCSHVCVCARTCVSNTQRQTRQCMLLLLFFLDAVSMPIINNEVFLLYSASAVTAVCLLRFIYLRLTQKASFPVLFADTYLPAVTAMHLYRSTFHSQPATGACSILCVTLRRGCAYKHL